MSTDIRTIKLYEKFLQKIKEDETSRELERSISDFVKDQEPLGEEFQKVLNDNLWYLYGS